MGISVAISSNGNTVLIGGQTAWAEPASYYFQGAAWVFVRSAGVWTQQGPKLTAGNRYQYFGTSVALAGDGTSALIGGPGGLEALGGTGPAVWVFRESGGKWSQTQELREPGGDRGFGIRSISSEDGETALIQGELGVWAYQDTGEAWEPFGEEPITAGEFGGTPTGLALSATGETAVVGTPSTHENQGEAIVYQRVPLGPGPTVTKLSAKNGSPEGGTEVTITGRHFVGVHAVRFGAVRAASWRVTSEGTIIATSPPDISGPVDVTVKTVSGTSPSTSKDRFTYSAPVIKTISPDEGPTAGSTSVSIAGAGFAVGTTGTVVHFGRVLVGASCVSTTSCTTYTPTVQKPGAVIVTASVHGENGKASTEARFTYY
jgi:hypothetical protein